MERFLHGENGLSKGKLQLKAYSDNEVSLYVMNSPDEIKPAS